MIGAARKSLFAVGMLLLTGIVAAQRKPPPPPASPVPLVVVDATGKIAGRLMDSFLSPQGWRYSHAAIDVNGVLVIASLSHTSTTSGAVARRLYWSPSLQPSLYYPTTDCSGAPFVTDVEPLGAHAGVRKSVVDVDPTTRNRILYVGADSDAVQVTAFSRRDFRCTSPATCFQDVNMVCILNNSFNVVAVLPAASFNLDATYPPPLTIR